MARFYSNFSGTAGSPPSVYHNHLVMTGGATLKSNLIAARDALSAQMYAQLDTANKNGNLGTVLPEDGFTVAGGNLSWSNVYTNSSAVWTSDPSARPTTDILVSNSTAVSPTDSGSISSTYYTDAVAALNAVMAGIAGGGPYARIGPDAWKTLASVYHDHALTYFAWDDYLPGTVVGLSASTFGSASAFNVDMSWSSYQYNNDSNPAGKVRVTASLGGYSGGASGYNYSYDSGYITPPGAKTAQWNAGSIQPGNYYLDVFVVCKDPSGNEGTQAHYGPVSITAS